MKNPKVVAISLLALVCLVLTFTIDWLFIIPAVFFTFLGHKWLFGK